MLIGVDHGNKQIKTVHCNPFVSGQIIHPGYFLPGRSMKKCGVGMAKTVERLLPASLGRSAEN